MPRPRKPASPFRYFNSSPEVIRLVVLMYVRFPLSLRNVEDEQPPPGDPAPIVEVDQELASALLHVDRCLDLQSRPSDPPASVQVVFVEARHARQCGWLEDSDAVSPHGDDVPFAQLPQHAIDVHRGHAQRVR